MKSPTGVEALMGGPANFRTTHWSVVLLAGSGDGAQASEALDCLCRAYWRPIYVLVRRRGYDASEAQDLVQGFFSGLIQRQGLERIEQSKGRFRSFLATAMTNYLINERKRERRLKRGGSYETFSFDAQPEEQRYQIEPTHELTPERLFEQRWAQTVLDRVVARLQADFAAAGHADRFECLKEFLLNDPADVSYVDAGARLGLSVSAVTSAIHRMRLRYRDSFREEIAQTVADPAEIDDEIRYLVGALSVG
jgi:RNA polymerase sigma-70 factor (ECF subfamily)